MHAKPALLSIAASVMAFAFAGAQAATIVVAIIDSRGAVVPDAVVMVTPQAVPPGRETPAAPAATAVMDQIDKAFVPAVLVVRAGTAVIFPNSDTIAHQVYSFSQPKRFELPLYRGRTQAPIVFDQPGVVVLGCNIHDTMVGHIVIADTPWFGKSDTHGRWTSDAPPPGTYRVRAWSARLPRVDQPAEQLVTLSDAAASTVRIQLAATLRPLPVAKRDGRIRDY